MSLKMECYSKWNITPKGGFNQNGVSLTMEYRSKWNVINIGMSLKLNVIQIGMSLKFKCHSN